MRAREFIVAWVEAEVDWRLAGYERVAYSGALARLPLAASEVAPTLDEAVTA
jgi:hypothetical protein